MMLIAERTKPPLPARGVAWRKAWITEHLEGHYEFEEVPFGRVYRWCPESVVVECECGQRISLTRTHLISDSANACDRCGAGLGVDLQEEEVVDHMLKDDEALHPWRYWQPPKNAGILF